MVSTADTLAWGWKCYQAGDHARAEQAYRQVLQAEPTQAQAWYLLGELYQAAGKPAAAAACLSKALKYNPHAPEIHNSLGVALARQGRLDMAITCFEQALHLSPDHAEAHNNLGLALWRQGKPEKAAASYRQALALRPDYIEAHNNLGVALAKQDQFALAAASYRQALVLRPDYAEAHNNLGSALVGMGQYDEALSCYQRALQLEPGHAKYHLNLAESLLHLGNLERGWAEMEWRWQATAIPRPSFSQPMWDGTPLAGRTILVYAEQGFGDTFQFVRYLPLVKQRGGTVLFVCQASLLRILSGCPGIDRLLPRGAELPAFDVQVPLMSLSGIFKTTLSTIPRRVPYLSADSQLVEAWRRELSEVRDFKVGIARQGRSSYEGDRLRSPRLGRFEPLARIEGVRLFSLQKGDGAEQRAEVQGRFRVTAFGDRLDSVAGPFMDTAALMMNFDLVVSPDTAVAHLAGALGRPVWVVLSFAADWRWLLARDDVPWYPTMQLFRQSEFGDWEGVFERVTAALRQRLQSPMPGNE